MVVLVIFEKGGLLVVLDVYMKKLAVLVVVKNYVDINKLVIENFKIILECMDCVVEELVVVVMDCLCYK